MTQFRCTQKLDGCISAHLRVSVKVVETTMSLVSRLPNASEGFHAEAESRAIDVIPMFSAHGNRLSLNIVGEWDNNGSRKNGHGRERELRAGPNQSKSA